MSVSRTPPHANLRLVIVLATGLIFTACSTTNNDAQPAEPDASEHVTTAEQPTHETTDATIEETSTQPVGEFTTELQQSPDWPAFGDTQGIYPVDVRSALHDGFERIVIEHAGTGTPSYLAQYTNDPVAPGSGQPVDTGDSAYLEVIASGTASIDEIDEERMLDNGVEITDLQTHATGTVVSFAPWEATSNYLIGLDEQRPYAIAILDDPVRIIIDIQLDDV